MSELVILRVNSSQAMNSLARYQVATKKTWGQVLRESLRRVALNLVYQTQPFGNGTDSQKRGQAKVAKDMAKVYATIGQIYEQMESIDKESADAFYYFAKLGKWSIAERILRNTPIYNRNVNIGSFDGGTAHKSRFQGGRLRGSKIASLIVKNESSQKAYLKKKQALVGFGKSGWVEVAKKLGGTKGIPGWVKKNKGPGSVREKLSQDDPRVLGTNEVSYVSQILKPTQIAEAYKREERIALSQAKHAERAAAKKAGLA